MPGSVEEEKVTSREMAQLAEKRSAVYSFLGRILFENPQEDWLNQFREPQFQAFLEELKELSDGAALVQGFIEKMDTLTTQEALLNLSKERTRLLRGVNEAYSPPPPYESVYVSSQRQMGEAVPKVAERYREAGFWFTSDVHESPDYLALEIDFLRALSAEEEKAWLDEDWTQLKQILAREVAFLKEHVLNWLPLFYQTCLQWSPHTFYQGILKLTMDFAGQDREFLDQLKEFES